MLALGWNSPQGVESPRQRRGSDSWPLVNPSESLSLQPHLPSECSDLFPLRFSIENPAREAFVDASSGVDDWETSSIARRELSVALILELSQEIFLLQRIAAAQKLEKRIFQLVLRSLIGGYELS